MCPIVPMFTCGLLRSNFSFAMTFHSLLLVVIPEGDLLLHLLFCLSSSNVCHPRMFVILECLSSSNVCHPRRGSASALAFLFVILEEDLLLAVAPTP
jgi:hypothetical protein